MSTALNHQIPGDPRKPAALPKTGIPWWGIVLIVMGGSVPILGIMAAIAIPAFSKYMRRAKVTEAKTEVSRIYAGVESYWHEHGTCPTGGTGLGGVGPTPPLSVNCNEGPGGTCVPATDRNEPGFYAVETWSGDEVWRGLGYHYCDGFRRRNVAVVLRAPGPALFSLRRPVGARARIVSLYGASVR